MATPKTISLPNLTSGGTASQMAGINSTIAKINSALSGGITGIKGQPSGQSGAVYFTPQGAQNATGGAVTSPLGVPITSSSLAPTTPIQVPIAPATTPTAGIMAGVTAGLGIQSPIEKTNEQIAQQEKELYASVLGPPPSIGEEYKQAYQSEILPKQQEVNNLKAQIGAITAQSNADILAVRNQSSTEGGTAGILSAREDAINRSSAIKVLPLSASLAAAQDNLALSQQYLDKWFSIRQEDLQNDYQYRTSILNSIKGELTKKEERQWQVQMLGVQQAYKQQSDFLDTQKQLLINATQQKAPASVISAISNAKDILGATSAAGQWGMSANDKADLAYKQAQIASANRANQISSGNSEQLYAGLSSPTATAVRAKVSKYSTEPMVQNFATIQDGYNFAKSISNTTKNPADDQALIYSLAKTLDPNSVVREGEYATAQKYSQSWVASYGKGVTQALAGTGFLSETARQNIKKTIETKYNASLKSYENISNQYISGINNLTGRNDGGNFIIDYITPVTETKSDTNAWEKTSTAWQGFYSPKSGYVIPK